MSFLDRRALVLAAPLFLAVALVPVGCSSGGGGGGGGAAIFAALGLDVEGQTDVKLNQPVVVTFNGAVAPNSVSVSGFQIQGGGQVFNGRIVVRGNTITFFPTVFNGVDGRGIDQSINNYNPPNNPADNANGFQPATNYTLFVLGNSVLSPKGINGRPVAQTFSRSFRTGTEYLPEDPPVAPMITAIRFNQVAANVGCGPDPLRGDRNLPLYDPDGNIICPPAGIPVPAFDPANLQITVTFSEPMRPSLFNPFTTFRLTNVTLVPPRAILGQVVPRGDLRSFDFRPLNTLGDDALSSNPYDFEFQLDGKLADLAGNTLVGNPPVDGRNGPIIQPIVYRLQTINKPGEPNFGAIFEDFITTTFRDGSILDGTSENVWTGNGVLEGALAAFREVSVPVNPAQFLLPQPLTREGNKIQHLIAQGEINPPGLESIIGISWGPQSNFVFAALYPEVTMSVGHTRIQPNGNGLGATFASNFSGFPNNPTQVFRGAYRLQNALNRPFENWPQFETDFEYNSRDNVVLEMDVAPGGDTFQLFKNESSACMPRYRVFGGYNRPRASGGNPPGQCGAGENTRYQHRLRLVLKKSFAVSRYYDTFTTSPDYTAPLVIRDPSRVGSSFVLTFFGAPPNSNIPPGADVGRAVGPFSDINQIDGFRFAKFVFELNADAFTGIIPLIDSLSFSFRVD